MVAGHSEIRNESGLSGREIQVEKREEGGDGEAQKKVGSEGTQCFIERDRAAANTAEKSRKMSTEESLQLSWRSWPGRSLSGLKPEDGKVREKGEASLSLGQTLCDLL